MMWSALQSSVRACFVGEDYDPTAGEYAAAGSLSDFGAILAGYQISGGGFDEVAKQRFPSVQWPPITILALNEVDMMLL